MRDGFLYVKTIAEEMKTGQRAEVLPGEQLCFTLPEVERIVSRLTGRLKGMAQVLEESRDYYRARFYVDVVPDNLNAEIDALITGSGLQSPAED